MIIFVKQYKHTGKRKKTTFLQILGSSDLHRYT